MAKKKKQKKAGLAKRQKNRQQKKISRKKRILASQPIQKKMSPSKLKKSLKNLPSLIFEPELEEVAFSADQVENAISQFEKTPDQIDAIATPEFNQKLVSNLELMKTRFEAEKDSSKLMMVTAMLYFIEQENAPAFLNQIIVGMFCRAVAEKETGQPLTDLKELNQLLNDYDDKWRSYLEEKVAAMEQVPQVPFGATADEEVEAEEDAISIESPFEAVIEDFDGYLSEDLEYNEEDQERVIEDVEVLLNDYFEEKQVTELSDIRSRRVKSFLESWFIRNMHPTREDLENMFVSLGLFFKFAKTRELIDPEVCQEIELILENKDPILSSLEI